MATTSVNNNDMKAHQHIPILTDVQLSSITGEDNETDIDGTTENENLRKSSIKPSEISIPIQPLSDISLISSSMKINKSKTRSYKFVELERALTAAKFLKNDDDKNKFEDEYLLSINENKFDEFLNNYYQKLHDYYEHIKREQELKKARIFTFIDLEKNFLALDPTRDIKILFLDEPTSSTITKSSNTRSISSAHQRSTTSFTSNDTATEKFYTNRCQHLLSNPSRARDEITMFARRAAEHLHERLPRMSSVPHRVKILDERDTTGKPDERTLLQMKHKRTLSLIAKRRHIIIKMITQAKKNQIKMEKQWKQTPLTIDNSIYCRELLEKANQIEHVYKEEQQIRRPQTGIISRRISNKKMLSSTSSDIVTTNTNSTHLFSSSSTPFRDALSIDHIEKTKNIRILRPTRPLTAPTKVNWINYC